MTASDPITFTTAAAQKVYTLIAEEDNFKLNLRAYVIGGGCSGFEYGFTFDETVNDDDFVIEQKLAAEQTEDDSEGGSGGSGDPIVVKLLVDALSAQYLTGAEIDFKDDLEGAHFVITNPNAKTTCGCGSSFSV